MKKVLEAPGAVNVIAHTAAPEREKDLLDKGLETLLAGIHVPAEYKPRPMPDIAADIFSMKKLLGTICDALDIGEAERAAVMRPLSPDALRAMELTDEECQKEWETYLNKTIDLNKALTEHMQNVIVTSTPDETPNPYLALLREAKEDPKNTFEDVDAPVIVDRKEPQDRP